MVGRAQARGLCHVAILLSFTSAYSQTGDDDAILRAMRDELARSRSLRLAGLDPPYFLQYIVEDLDAFSVTATLGALISTNHAPVRVQEVRVRVGDYAFDNTNHVYSDYYSGTRYDPEQLPLENNYSAIRETLWLATDRAYKAAEEAMSRKRSSLQNVNVPEQLPDYSKARPVQSIQPIHRAQVDEATWKARV